MFVYVERSVQFNTTVIGHHSMGAGLSSLDKARLVMLEGLGSGGEGGIRSVRVLLHQ